MSSQVITGAVKGADHLICIFNNRSYIEVTLEVGSAFEVQYLLKSRCLFEGTSVHCDQGVIGFVGM